MAKRPSFLTAAAWQFNIDAHLNRFLAPSVVPHLPRPVAHFLGYRPPPPARQQRKIGNLIIIAWAFIGVFCGVSVVNVVSYHIPDFIGVDGAVTTVGSFGAAAVLEFYAIESPLAQPRNAVFGQLLSCIIGVAVTRLFSFLPPDRFEDLRWLAASVACAAATAVMALTGTVHPPAGATAVIAVTDDNAYQLGWKLIPVVLLGSVLMQVIALIINNLQRRYPMYWWSPEEVGQFWTKSDASEARNKTADEKEPADADKESGVAIPDEEDPDPEMGHVTFTRTRTPSTSVPLTAVASLENAIRHPRVTITRNRVVVPDSIYLRPEERLMLEALSERL
ncbi:hypothetical protein Sste5346_008465 [Sporothrix stenoceras]|uniref:HPP transmembrane region domain-containing protein n=1 Tax=Sporothrix stenoceras TaxID=5173 RepID=A0ABR3YPX1_9PEZI